MNFCNSIIFTGYIHGEEKNDFLKNADLLFLHTMRIMGIVYAEALAAGTPVVADTKTPWQAVEKYNCGKWVENESRHLLMQL